MTIFVAMAFDASARYKGDLNGDDRVDLADMVYLAQAINAGSTDKAVDRNAAGKVDEYDLHKLADIIISGKLIEDTGMNVGIGGWDDTGEDYGGTVKAPALITRSVDDTRFFLCDPKSEYDDVSSVEFGISEGGDRNPYGILISLEIPVDRLNSSDPVQLAASIGKTHKIYGTPKMVKQKYNDDWSPVLIRFIIFSQDLRRMSATDGKLGRILYSATPSPDDETGFYFLSQIISGDDMSCIYLPEHDAGFYGHFYTAVDTLNTDDAPCDIYSISGELLRKSVPASELGNLDRGLYLIRQGGKTTKLLK